MAKSFAHLHCHTSYSVLDGAAKIPELVAAAKADNQVAICASEHGNLYSAVELYKECKKQGDIKAIFGSEQYMVHDRLERTSLKRDSHSNDFKARYHLTVLAENNTGWQNLIKLSSDSYLKGFYQKPRTDWDALTQYSDGLIVTSGCLGGVVLQHLLNDDMDGAVESASRLQDIFGKENFFIELQDHGLPEQAKTNPRLVDISKLLGAPVLATNDLHYVKHEDHVAHDSLLCCQTGAQRSDPNRFKFSSDQHYLKTSEEMRYLFRDIEESCDNTLWIAERADVNIDFDTLHLPVFPVPEGYDSPIHYLTYLAYDGFEKKYPNANEEAIGRLAYELGVIDSLGLASYFLIVWDLLRFADSQNILYGPGRGSAAGSIVSYCVGITAPDPLEYGLIFERFIDPHRVALADIDLDFDTRYRDHLINYVKDKYGEDHVAQIITFGIIKARVAVRDAARVLGHPPDVGDKLSKAMPELLMGEDTPLWACFEQTERYAFGYSKADRLRAFYESDPTAKEVIDVALGLEGLVRQDGIHAAALVIGDRPLTDIVPVQRRGDDAPVVTQWPKDTIEDLGLVKMDFLGLRNLDVITDCLHILGTNIDINDIPLDDSKTYRLLQAGRTTGVFQMESPGMKKLLKRLRPSNIEDLSAVIALYRPGPMQEGMHTAYADRKNGNAPVKFFHEDARELLKDTYGLAIFQEQIMRIAQKFAGYDMSEADALRKIMGKKLVDKMKTERIKFLAGCKAQGYTEDFSSRLFDMIEGFARYSFNKAHSISYAYIGYQTAYLKANYPKEYMAALCGSVSNDIERCAVFLHEARQMGIDILTPDINKSEAYFSVVNEGIIVGLAAIKGLGAERAEDIIRERETNGEFKSLIDFIERTDPNVTVLDALCWAGAMDQFGTRLGIVSVSDNILSQYRRVKKKLQTESLFDTGNYWDVEIPDHEYKESVRLKEEKRVLGLYISGHPLYEYAVKESDVLIAELGQIEPSDSWNTRGTEVLCIVSSVKHKKTRKGDMMAELILEDATGAIECPVFPAVYKRYGVPDEGAIGTARLRIGTDRDGQRSYAYQSFIAMKQDEEEDPQGRFLNLYLPRGFAQNERMVSKLKGILLGHSGPQPVNMFVGKQTRVKLPYDFSVRKSDTLLQQINDLFIEYGSKKSR